MSKLAADIGKALHHLLRQSTIMPGFRSQFRPQQRGLEDTARAINAAFLIILTGERLSYPAKGYLSSLIDDPEWGGTAQFYLNVLDQIEEELSDPDLADLGGPARELVKHLETFSGALDAGTLQKLWNVFSPEGTGLAGEREDLVRQLRERRSIAIEKLSPSPVSEPFEQILFTSNVLLTIPLERNVENLPLAPGLASQIQAAALEEQVFWYDHPIPMGMEIGKNEAVYGLKALDEAVRYEIDRENAPSDVKMPVLLSISATHKGLQTVAPDYLAGELERSGGIDHLRVHAVAEKDVRRLLDEVISPASKFFFPERDTKPLTEIFGVDGEYGRHYSFLKSLSALWQALIDPKIVATFKFDLDQVFPQENLVSETGRSAFEHLCDPLWGAVGVDSSGREVELGMFAGALVNQSEIDYGLFTPDVKWIEEISGPDFPVFAAPWLQALSTEAEMMARYVSGGPDGQTSCLQRFHVTGGTTGIRVEHLRKHRPFTPSWIGRAEDQAYILSVLFPQRGAALRYAHASGFIMRHDKEDFAGEAIRSARIGKMVGDYVRILNFTSLARALPWEVEAVKSEVDPFTGCFISRIPVTVAALRMALTAAVLFASGTEEGRADGTEIVMLGSSRLDKALRELGNEEAVRQRFLREKEGWDLYYDVLDELEKRLSAGDTFANSLRERARDLVEGWRVKTGDSEV